MILVVNEVLGTSFAQSVQWLEKNFPEKIFVHRMDGLQKLYNDQSDTRQDLAINYNKLSRATIFQSHWAKNKFHEAGFNPAKSTVIYNFADDKIFNQNHKKNHWW